MSVFNLTGTGELYCKKTGSVVKVELKISSVNGRTRIHCYPRQESESFPLAKMVFRGNEVALKNVIIGSAAGELKADYLADVYINYKSSSFEGKPQLITQLTKAPESEHTLSYEAVYLWLTSSNLRFEIISKQTLSSRQIMFIGAAQSINDFGAEITLGNQTIKIRSYGNTHPTLAGLIVAEFEKELSDHDNTALRLSLELFLRQKLGFLADIQGNKVTLNLIDHSTVSYSSISGNEQYSFQKIKEFVYQNPSYRTYFRFLVELVGNSGVIDDRLLNGFVALEALFDDKKLRKEKVSEKLKVSLDTADLIKELRNKMFHYGESIAETVQIISREKEAHTQATLNSILNELKDNTEVSWILYSGFTDLMFAHFAELVGLDPRIIKRQSRVDLRDNDWYKNLEFDQ